ncbi:MAG: prepilin-type N-terminal cleavage/methylation domain-containing protein [Akkermansiaceae bacterium]
MKLTNTLSMKRKSGMTLLELTVVILVLLSLISILFVGARAWKKGSDRSANIMNIRNVQQAARGHENMNNLKATDALLNAVIVSATGATGYMKTPTPPATLAAYTYADVVTAPGFLYTSNNALIAEYGFKAAGDYEGW